MRIINLDETGIKLISSCKDQTYISLDQLPAFAKGNYTLEGNKMTVNGDVLELSERDLKELPSIMDYVKQRFLNEDEN